MSEKEFTPLIFTSQPDNLYDYKPLEEPDELDIMQIGITPLVIDIIDNIAIPQGYVWNQQDKIQWSVCVDQHDLRVITTQIRGNESLRGPLYTINLIGDLHYNQIVSGFEPLSGRITVQSGSAGENNQYGYTSQLQSSAAFSSTGYKVVNEIISYATSIINLQENLINNFSIDVVQEHPSILLPDGTVIVYDPDNAAEFYSMFDGTTKISFIIESSVVVTSNVEPAS